MLLITSSMGVPLSAFCYTSSCSKCSKCSCSRFQTSMNWMKISNFVQAELKDCRPLWCADESRGAGQEAPGASRGASGGPCSIWPQEFGPLHGSARGVSTKVGHLACRGALHWEAGVRGLEWGFERKVLLAFLAAATEGMCNFNHLVPIRERREKLVSHVPICVGMQAIAHTWFDEEEEMMTPMLPPAWIMV